MTRQRYKADREAVQAYFLGVVEQTIGASVAAVRRYVREYLADRLAEARGRLSAYAEQYTAVMESSLAMARLGKRRCCGVGRIWREASVWGCARFGSTFVLFAHSLASD